MAMGTNESIVRDVYRQLAAKDMRAVLDKFADDCRVEFVGPSSIPFAGVYRGKTGMQAALGRMAETAEMLELVPDEVHQDGEHVNVIGHETGRVKATGREWKSRVSDSYVVRDGKIQSLVCMFDTAAVADAYLPHR